MEGIKPARPKIEYVIFDMDGLLIDSERIYTEVTNEILGQYGKEMTWDIKAGLMGMPEREAAAHLLSFFPDLPPTFTIDTYLTQRRTAQDLRWPSVQPLPGATRLVRHLHRHKVPLALATGSQRRNFALKSAHLHDTLFGCFEGRVVCPDDGLLAAGRGKPCPDVFLVAAERWLGRRVGMEPAGVEELSERARGLVFEDAVAGVQAGKRAGMNVVWVPDPNLLALGGDAITGAEQPDQMLRSLEDFDPVEWGLPPYDELSDTW